MNDEFIKSTYILTVILAILGFALGVVSFGGVLWLALKLLPG
uniref:Uncharacterized protein n=1 Tax=viral metagenome TaxID=1070528 RepID=A0A6M3KAV6_9ZZZZ